MRLPWLVALAAVPGTAWTQPAGGPPGETGRQKDIVIVTEPDRPANNKILLASLAGGAALFGGIGLYFHLDSRSASNDVSAKRSTNTAWTSADAARYDQAHSSATKAEVFYGIGGALLVGAVVTWIVTAPNSETTVIHTGGGTPVVAPTPGGALVGGAWTF
ncbi:MAG: hypothetical protein ACM31C_00255 [Acidobacteriota bacterium]